MSIVIHPVVVGRGQYILLRNMEAPFAPKNIIVSTTAFWDSTYPFRKWTNRKNDGCTIMRILLSPNDKPFPGGN